MKILFRCNAGPDIGLGHLMRCRGLAHALKERGQQCVMVGPDFSYVNSVDHEIFEDWISISDWLSSFADAQKVVDIARAHQATWFVLDDYRVDEDYQLALREAGMRWLQFDGSASTPSWANLIVNANPDARAENYIRISRNPNTCLLLGPDYAILRPEFQRIVAREPGRPVEKILVTFGGGDDHGANQFALSTLLSVTSSKQTFVVVSGAANPSNSRLKKWIASNGEARITLHVEPAEVAPLFASCDVAVMGGGVSTYEASRCGLPMILMTIADNQIPQSVAWDKAGVARYLGKLGEVDRSKLICEFSRLLSSDHIRKCMSTMAQKMVDGRGADRVGYQLRDKKKATQVSR